MTKAEDEFGKQILSPLKSVPPVDPQVAAEEKARFLLLVEEIRQGILPESSNDSLLQEYGAMKASRGVHRFPLLGGLVALLIALIVIFGSSLTVYAAQGSLPGEGLYPLKSISEDIRLSLTHSPRARLDLTLEYSQRRVGEISQILAMKKNIPAKVSERLQDELESALQIAAQMDDLQMVNALEEIRGQAENQGKTFNGLIPHLTEQNEPAIVRLQERLREQVKLSAFGASDPQKFRMEIRERQNRRMEMHKSNPNAIDKTTIPNEGFTTPYPTEIGNKQDHTPEQPTQAPDSEDDNPGMGNPDPGNGNNKPEPSRTPKP
jgi:hypothetical protein